MGVVNSALPLAAILLVAMAGEGAMAHGHGGGGHSHGGGGHAAHGHGYHYTHGGALGIYPYGYSAAPAYGYPMHPPRLDCASYPELEECQQNGAPVIPQQQNNAAG